MTDTSEPSAERQAAFEAWAKDQWGDRAIPHNAWLGFEAGAQWWQARAGVKESQPVAWANRKTFTIEPHQAYVVSTGRALPDDIPLYTHSRAEAPVPAEQKLLAWRMSPSLTAIPPQYREHAWQCAQDYAAALAQEKSVQPADPDLRLDIQQALSAALRAVGLGAGTGGMVLSEFWLRFDAARAAIAPTKEQ